MAISCKQISYSTQLQPVAKMFLPYIDLCHLCIVGLIAAVVGLFVVSYGVMSKMRKCGIAELRKSQRVKCGIENAENFRILPAHRRLSDQTEIACIYPYLFEEIFM
jgi:hypothetical protein